MSLENFMNTSEGMTEVASMKDDDTISCAGASWFKYNGITCDTIYISGNSWVGFGASSEHMKIDRRDAKCHHLYRQELIYNLWHCVKFRWEGYSYYNQTSETYRLVWELFLFETGDLFLNVIKNSGYGTNAFDTLGGSGVFNPITGAHISGYCRDVANGKAFELVDELYYHKPPVVLKYIIEKEDGYFSVVNDALSKLSITSLTAENFKNYGMDDLPDGNCLKSIKACKIHRWQDDVTYDMPGMAADVNAVPKTQVITQNYDIDFSHESIASINNVQIHATIPPTSNMRFAVSLDSGLTWQVLKEENWIQLDINDLESFMLSGMTKESLEGITNEQWISFVTDNDSTKYRFAILVDANSTESISLSDIVINYINV